MHASATDSIKPLATASSTSGSASTSSSGTATASAPAPSADIPGQIPLPTVSTEGVTPVAKQHSKRTNKPGRKGHYSCDFCRVRKLRCDRPLPCTNCISRGKKCSFVSGDGRVVEAGQVSTQARTRREMGNRTQGSGDMIARSDTGDSTPPSSHPSEPLIHDTSRPPTLPQGSLLAEIQALRKLAQDLEKRVAQTSSSANGHDDPPPVTSPNSARFDIGSTRANLSSNIGEVGQVVAQLERVSMGPVSHAPAFVDALIFKTERIQDIPRAPGYANQLGKPTRCIMLPLQEEAKVLVEKFIKSVSYIYRVVHHPSLPKIVDDVYRQISGQEPIRPGHLVLLLSIIATATHVWGPEDGQTGSSSLLFSSTSQANSQTPFWIKTTHDVLNARQNYPTASLENVQGVAILSFLISNLEGVSLRYRALISTGLLLGREMGLHRTDHPSNLANANSVEAEMGRRVWWYLVSTDWLMAARVGGPGEGVYLANPDHMMVKKPRNVNDVDLPRTFYHQDPPLAQPTEMSYFIQRIRLAEISRRIIDHNSMVAFGPGRPRHDAHIIAMDVEIDRMLHDLPAFFHLENYAHELDDEATNSFIQAYLLNSLVHTVRCKLHLGYLSSGQDVNCQTHVFSRNACLSSARQLLRAEMQLMRTRHPFVETRLHLAGILYGIFVASIVLLMDAYVTGSPLDETRRLEVNEALRIVEDAKGHSLAAANLHESLTDVLAKHRSRLEQRQHLYQRQQHQQYQTQSHYYPQQQQPVTMPMNGHPMARQYQQGDQFMPVPDPVVQAVNGGHNISGPTDPNIGAPVPYGISEPMSYDNQLVQGLEALMEYDGFQWDDLLSGIDPTSFF